MPTSAPDPEHPPFPRWDTAWRLVLPPLRLVARLGWRLQVEGEKPGSPGPAVYAANHLSHLDIPMLGVAVNHPMRFLAVDELWGEHRWLDWVLRTFGAIPLSRRRPPLGAVRAALAHLAVGGVVGIFPEGGIRAGFDPTGLHPAAAWISLRSGAPLVPVAITGTDLAYGLGAARVRRSDVRVRFGPPIAPEAFRSLSDPQRGMMDQWSAWICDHGLGRG